MGGGDATPQTAAAAKLLAATLDFKVQLDAEAVKPDASRDGPMDMNQYARLFAHARLPHATRDTLVNFGRSPEGLPYPHFATTFRGANPRHVAVIVDGRVYALDVLREDGTPMPVDDLEAGLRQLQAVARTDGNGGGLVNVPTLTAEDRTVWAAARAELASHPDNARSLDTIDSALLVLALESETPATPEGYSESLLLGGDGQRWFDKHQFVVFPDGEAGGNFEHAPGDGTTVLGMLAHVKAAVGSLSVTGAGSAAAANVRACPFVPVGGAAESVDAACRERAALMASFNTAVKQVPIGASRIKLHNCSPDAFAQMAMQLAAFRLHDGNMLATYESNSTRGFLHGRTETVRSASVEALRFCRAINRSPGRDALAKLHDAVAAHGAYVKMSKDGFGVDRPLYGLKNIAVEAGETLHPLFTDASFALSNSWRLSTSHVGGPSKLFTFGPVVGDGYGVGYFVSPDLMMFDVTAWTDGTPHSAADFATAVEEAAYDMDSLCAEFATG